MGTSKKYSNLFLDLFALPLVMMWIESILHFALKLDYKYAIVFLPFAVFCGAVFTVISSLFGYKKSALLSGIFGVVLTLIYVIEYEAKLILATFYPFSVLETAKGNKLDDYFGAVVSTVLRTSPWILLFFVPSILMLFIHKHKTKKPRGYKNRTVIILSLMLAIVMFLFAILVINIVNWKSDVTPEDLYYTAGDFDAQTEALGLHTMLRLDIKYTILGLPQREPDIPPVDPIEPDEELDTSKNIIDIDWNKVANSTSNKDIKTLASIFSSISGTKKNEWTGKMKGYNVIFLTLEGMSGYAISEEYTPTLYRLTHEGFVLNNFYTALHYTSTSGGECQNLLGLYPENNKITMRETGELKTNCYFSLATILEKEGYYSWGFHNNVDMYGREKSHENLGYDWYYINYNSNYKPVDNNCMSWEGSKGIDSGKLRWSQRDSYMMDVTTPLYTNSDTPFNAYYITISGHYPYSLNTWWVTDEDRALLAKSGYSKETQAYIASCMEVDRAFANLLENLEAAGKLENTLIVATPDHIPYFSPEELEELAGRHFAEEGALANINERNIDFEVYHSAAILWSASMEEPVEINKVCCQVDLLPTILNLLGVEYDSRVLGGTDILSESEGMVVFMSKCWRTDVGFYNAFTQKFTPNEGINMSSEALANYVESMRKIASNRLAITSKILATDFYDYVYASGNFLREPGAEAKIDFNTFNIRYMFNKKYVFGF